MLLTIEGIDGCGKSTVVRLLAEKFADHRVKAAVRHMPRDLVRKNMNGLAPMALAMLFMADHAQGFVDAAEVIASKDAWLVQDRGFLSTAVYQFGDCLGDNPALFDDAVSCSAKLLAITIAEAMGRENDLDDIHMPIVVLHTPVEECMRRIAARSERDIFETDDIEVWKHRDAIYAYLVKRAGAICIETENKTPAQIADEIWERVIQQHLPTGV